MQRALDLAEALVADGRVPGVAACVVGADGALVAERYAGVTEQRGADPVGPDTLFAAASLTKPVVGTACMVAVEEGLLELDAPVRDGFALRHLLSHCAGLPVDGDLVDAPPAEPPGTFRRYSNAGYNLAGRLLADAAQMPAPEYVDAAVLEPLRADASLGLAPADEARVAIVREPGNSDRGEQLFNGPLFRARGSAAGGLYTTARAYAAVLGCLLAGGSAPGGAILVRETVDEFLAPQFGELPGEVGGVGAWDALAWGLGFDVRGTREPHWTGSALSPTASSHFGAAGTLAWLDRELGAGLVVLANRGTYSGWWRGAGGWGDISAAVRDALTSR